MSLVFAASLQIEPKRSRWPLGSRARLRRRRYLTLKFLAFHSRLLPCE
jgi:hypothetical protein